MKYSALVSKLVDEFEERFQDFQKHADDMNMISNPFNIDPSDASDEFQLELIDIHNDSNLKTAYDQHDLVTFYKQYVSSESFPNLAKHAQRYCTFWQHILL